MRLRPFVCGIAISALVVVELVSAAQEARDSRVDLGGYQIHIQESGLAAPVVVFESGLGEDLTSWKSVQPQVAQFAHTLAYDRPGLGKSGPSPLPRDLKTMAVELHELLGAARIGPRIILVGHSLGGAIAQLFAHQYPSSVAGLVLVDPEDGRLDGLLRANMSPADWDARGKAIAQAMPTMPPAVRAELAAYTTSATYSDEMFSVGSLPVILLTGTKKNPEFPGNPLEQDLKLQMHRMLLARIPNSQHVLVPNSRHYLQNDAPEQVVNAIRSMVSRVGSQSQPIAR